MRPGSVTPKPQPRLFEPARAGALALKNRIVMAPCTRCRVDRAGVPTALVARYYMQRASAGLLISEGIVVSPQARGFAFTPGLHTPEQIDGWKKVTDAVHRCGGLIVAQLWHVGRISHPLLQPGGALPVAPSAVRPVPPDRQALTEQGPRPFETPRALRLQELPGIVEQFRRAAHAALLAGFDGVEVHGANGYLLDQFHRRSTNRRTDDYGGGIENRARLTLEVVDAVASTVGAARVGIRISPTNFVNDIDDAEPQAFFLHLVNELSARELAYLHVVEGDTRAPGRTSGALDYHALRRAFAGTYIANNGFDLDSALRQTQAGAADLVSFGRLFIANPDLVHRFQHKLPLNVPDASTFYRGSERGYIDYPMCLDTCDANP